MTTDQARGAIEGAPAPASLARRWISEGWWTDDGLGDLLADGLTAARDHAFSVRSARRPYRGTYGDVLDLARRFAGGLRARGVRAGDPVAIQLPNWMEAAAAFYAVALLGAVPVPIVHFYGPKEVSFILRQSGTRVLVTADRFAHQDFLANLAAMDEAAAGLETIVVVGDDEREIRAAGASTFADLVSGPLAGPLEAPVRVDPSSTALLAYTSGTTADPKGVVHTHRTIGAEIRQLGGVQPTAGLDMLVGAPVGHAIGMLAALLLPVWRRQSIHLIDVWDPATVLAAMVEDDLSAGAGATFFLLSLLDHPDFTDEHRRRMPKIGLGGSAIPAPVAERADAMGISIVRMYGSTEHPSITGSVHEDPREKRLFTDGRPLAGVELHLGDDGEIFSRGPDCCAGYTDAALTASHFDADGWYRTEDVGVLDDDGYLTIVDRKKDIIIRGGENVSALEVEEQLLRMSGIAEVAVVAAPDARLGEHACAFVRTLPGAAAPDLEDLRAHLAQTGLARQKWPEELRVVDDLPRTASGKVQKFALRDRLRTEATS